jgi:polar amino acid transport system substrate-binding protein
MKSKRFYYRLFNGAKVIYASLLFSFALCAAESRASNITFYTELYPPANFVQDNDIVGITPDILNLIWQQEFSNKPDIKMVPWARAYRIVSTNENTAIFTMAKTPERTPQFKWIGPVFKSYYVLMAKKDKSIKTDSTSDILNYRVATTRGDISELSLRKMGFKTEKLVPVTDTEKAIMLVVEDRVDLVIVSYHSFQFLSTKLNLDSQNFKVVWDVNQMGNYIGFNLKTPDALIEKLQARLDQLQPELLEIKAKYNWPIFQ